ncbi:hypothetical protein RND71_008009 [Anisodus tanguticus]|uniref:Uncharacterized protein n=1 Tax=Anisodus tanguticus TaxID=243964 RepID=A0AAE1QQH2_9SOLA|nr:hypothetical protein RND71_043798 [Anisodus tanguticus]KAK4372625.1 hypothetical protein RND71_008009 [Anisodus tanguticus]
MGLTLYLGIERGNIACHKSEARVGTLLREGRLASRAFRDEAFWRSQVNFGPPNPATDEKALWSKGKRVRCHTPCLPKVPRGRARRSRATTGERVPHWKGDRRRPSQGTSRPTGNTGETWESNPIGCQRIHSTCSLPDFIFIIFESEGKGSLFCNGKKGSRFDSAQPNDTSNTNDLCLECVARSLL